MNQPVQLVLRNGRRLGLAWLVALSVCIALCANQPDPLQAAERPPDVLFIVLDDMSADLSYLGGPAQTPALAALAQQGGNFTNAVVSSTYCNPSRISFWTGLLPTTVCATAIVLPTSATTELSPWRIGSARCPNFRARYPAVNTANIVTLFGAFHNVGYYVIQTGKLWHSRDYFNGEVADRDAGQPEPSRPDVWQRIVNKPLHGNLAYWTAANNPALDWGPLEAARDRQGRTFGEADLRDAIFVDDLLAEIAAAPTDQPLFAAIGFQQPHVPNYAPQRLLDLYNDTPLPAVDFSQIDRMVAPEIAVDSLALSTILADEDDWRLFMQSYYGAISFTDEQIGRLLQAWEASGRDLSNSLVVVWSDHGIAIGRHAHLYKGRVWREDTHIPLIIAGKGVPARTVTAPVNSVDVYPTLLELAGIPLPNDLPLRDGISLLPLLNGAQTTGRPAVTCVHEFEARMCAVETEQYTLLHWEMANIDSDRVELYDIRSDPGQLHNLATDPTYAALVEELRNVLKRPPLGVAPYRLHLPVAVMQRSALAVSR